MILRVWKRINPHGTNESIGNIRTSELLNCSSETEDRICDGSAALAMLSFDVGAANDNKSVF